MVIKLFYGKIHYHLLNVLTESTEWKLLVAFIKFQKVQSSEVGL